MRKEIKEASWVFLLGGFAAVLWWIFYVQPNDEIMTEIMNCMGDDRTRETYDECREIAIQEKKQ